MPNIIDSLFLELGIDTSKFSADQQKALKKIQEFESQTKRAAGNARGGIKTVGDAFRDLAKDSRLGSSAAGIENLATKLKNLGVSMEASEGMAGMAGMVRGLGMLLSPATIGAAAVGLLGKEMWDLNKAMTAVDATTERQAQLSDMNAKSLWSWGEAARTVGANPQDVTGGISSLQESIAGAMVGAGDASPQMMAMSRLGINWNPQNGLTDAQVTEMFTKVHQKAKALGYKNLGALRAMTRPFMNDAMFNISADPEFDPAKLQKQIEAMAPVNLNATFQKSLKSQMGLGQLDIDKDILAQTAYGSEQGLMQASVEILRKIAGGVIQLVNYFLHPVSTSKKIYDATVDIASRAIDDAVEVSHIVRNQLLPSAMRSRMSHGMQLLMDQGVSEKDAAAMMGSFARESSLNPLAVNAKGNRGYAQWDKSRQADFAKWAGYQMGSSAVPKDKQADDQILFSLYELQTKQKKAWTAMEKTRDLMGKTKAFTDLYERPGDNSLPQRFQFAQMAERLADVAGMVQAVNARTVPVQHTLTSETRIGDVYLNATSPDPKAHADVFRKGISDLPLMNAADLSTLGLSTRGATP